MFFCTPQIIKNDIAAGNLFSLPRPFLLLPSSSEGLGWIPSEPDSHPNLELIRANRFVLGVCPVQDLTLLIFDEAHKAQGNYAYCEVVRQVARHTKHFRVIGLSATPGSNATQIQST